MLSFRHLAERRIPVDEINLTKFLGNEGIYQSLLVLSRVEYVSADWFSGICGYTNQFGRYAEADLTR